MQRFKKSRSGEQSSPTTIRLQGFAGKSLQSN
jgi:hypothetical protein